MCNLPKLRGIKESYAWLKEQDPETQITLKGYSIMVKTGVIPSVRRGKKYLIDINTLPDAIKHWVDTGMREVEQKEQETLRSKSPRPATERRRGSGKYGQIRSIG